MLTCDGALYTLISIKSKWCVVCERDTLNVDVVAAVFFPFIDRDYVWLALDCMTRFYLRNYLITRHRRSRILTDRFISLIIFSLWWLHYVHHQIVNVCGFFLVHCIFCLSSLSRKTCAEVFFFFGFRFNSIFWIWFCLLSRDIKDDIHEYAYTICKNDMQTRC